ncbi:MAG: hypothetical protein ACPLW8_07295, partial [Candidatus Bathyarchaeales archaeon]
MIGELNAIIMLESESFFNILALFIDMNIIVRKFRTLVLNPVGVYRKYKARLKGKLIKLMGGIPPIYGEDYDRHWNYASFKNKVILDLGADYGSTAYYFLRKGASKVVAVEGDSELASKLRLNFQNDNRVIPIEDFIDDPKKIEALISKHHHDLVKVDIEGAERHILNVSNFMNAKEWLIETHSKEIHDLLSKFFTKHSFQIRSIDYEDDLR